MTENAPGHEATRSDDDVVWDYVSGDIPAVEACRTLDWTFAMLWDVCTIVGLSWPDFDGPDPLAVVRLEE